MDAARIVIVGAGFAGFHAARRLSRSTRGAAEIMLVNPTDYFLYLPLLPEVAGGVLDPRRVTVSLIATLRGVRLVLGEAVHVDIGRRLVHYVDPEGDPGEVGYDRLVVAVGSVNKLLPIPGVAEHAHGFRGVPEALFLRDHLTRQLELAAATDDADERAARCWLLLDLATRLLPELDRRLSRSAERVLRRRGVDVRLRTSVKAATPGGVHLTDGEFVPARSLVWCVGVRPDPLVEDLGLPTEKGRLVVDEYLTVPGYPEIFACGDAAAVPDLTRPGRTTPMTAQHAMRQGTLTARNLAASYGHGRPRPYRHHDLGFVVDLGGAQAAANPLGVPLSGPVAKSVTRGYHLLAVPANRTRIASEWVLDAALGRQSVQLGLVPSAAVPLDTASPELPRVRVD
jgi:NADH dehydrogenase